MCTTLGARTLETALERRAVPYAQPGPHAELALEAAVEREVDRTLAEVRARWARAAAVNPPRAVNHRYLNDFARDLADDGAELARTGERLTQLARATAPREQVLLEWPYAPRRHFVNERVDLLGEVAGRLVRRLLRARREGDAAAAERAVHDLPIAILEAALVISVNRGDQDEVLRWGALCNGLAGVAGLFLLPVVDGGAAGALCGGVFVAGVAAGVVNMYRGPGKSPVLMPDFVRRLSARRLTRLLDRRFWINVEVQAMLDPDWPAVPELNPGPEGDPYWRQPALVRERVIELIGGRPAYRARCAWALAG